MRTSGGLSPTARAKVLLPQLTASLDRIGGVLRPQDFDPAALDRTFRVASTDVQALLLGPPLLAQMRALAPRARLEFAAIAPDIRERLDGGDVDLVFALASTPLPPGAHSEPLAKDRLVLATRAGNRAPPQTLEEFAACEHVTVAIFGDGSSEIDAELAQAGLSRRIVLTTPHFLAALAAVGRTDCVTTLSAALARRFAVTLGLALHEPPLRNTSFTMTMVVPATRAQDPGVSWLKARLRQAAAEAYDEAADVVGT